MCVCFMGRGRALHTKSSALSKHSLIHAKAREKDLDSAITKEKPQRGLKALTFAKRFLQKFKHGIHAM